MDFFTRSEQHGGFTLFINDQNEKSIEVYFTKDELEELSNQLFSILDYQGIIEKIKKYAESCLEFDKNYLELCKDVFEDFLNFTGPEKPEISCNKFTRYFRRLYSDICYKQIKYKDAPALAFIGIKRNPK